MTTDYCLACGAYRDESTMYRCACGETRCAACHHESPLHLKHERDELLALAAALLDELVLGGKTLSTKEWHRVCLLTGRHCPPFVDV